LRAAYRLTDGPGRFEIVAFGLVWRPGTLETLIWT